jgi:hypothetical protein
MYCRVVIFIFKREEFLLKQKNIVPVISQKHERIPSKKKKIQTRFIYD